MTNADGLLLQGGEWDSPPDTSSISAKGGEVVKYSGEQCVGAGAEPLSANRLLAGHHSSDRPSGD